MCFHFYISNCGGDKTSVLPYFTLTGDFNVINGVLQTSYSVMRRYEFEHKSEELWREILFVLNNFAQPLTNLLVVCRLHNSSVI